MEEEYTVEIQQGYYNNLKLEHLDFVLVQNQDRYNELKKESEKDHRDTTARWMIDALWVKCVYLKDGGLTPVQRGVELPDSPVICVKLP